jgi:tyrosine-specific transport protein
MAVGTGMLALPVTTSFAGFFPAIIFMLICWFFMLMSGFMVVDVTLAFEGTPNFVTMTRKTLGPMAKNVTWILYLLLFYSINAAHILGSIPLFSNFLPFWASSLLLVFLSFGFVYKGTKAVDGLNRLMLLGVGISYAMLIIFLPRHIHAENLLHFDLKPIFMTIPVLFIAFGFQNLVPTLVTYLDRDGRKTKWAITLGTFLPFLVYSVWALLVMGVVPREGAISLAEAYHKGQPATIPLIELLQNRWISLGANLFTFFTLIASYVAISLGLVDFLADGLPLQRFRFKRAISTLLAFLPPLLFVYIYPKGFFLSLDYAGIFAAILVGVLPCLMASKLPATSFWKTPKGNSLLFLVLIFFLLTIGIEVGWKMGFFHL